jgi:hypothetical protein
MPTVNIVKQFTFTHKDGSEEVIQPGQYDLPDDMAEHFYVRAHSDDPLPPPVRPGTPAYSSQSARFNASNVELSRQEEMVAMRAAEIARQEFRKEMANQRPRMPLTRPRQGEEQEAVQRPGEFETEVQSRYPDPDSVRAEKEQQNRQGSRPRLRNGQQEEAKVGEQQSGGDPNQPNPTGQQSRRGATVATVRQAGQDGGGEGSQGQGGQQA